MRTEAEERVRADLGPQVVLDGSKALRAAVDEVTPTATTNFYSEQDNLSSTRH